MNSCRKSSNSSENCHSEWIQLFRLFENSVEENAANQHKIQSFQKFINSLDDGFLAHCWAAMNKESRVDLLRSVKLRKKKQGYQFKSSDLRQDTLFLLEGSVSLKQKQSSAVKCVEKKGELINVSALRPIFTNHSILCNSGGLFLSISPSCFKKYLQCFFEKHLEKVYNSFIKFSIFMSVSYNHFLKIFHFVDERTYLRKQKIIEKSNIYLILAGEIEIHYQNSHLENDTIVKQGTGDFFNLNQTEETLFAICTSTVRTLEVVAPTLNLLASETKIKKNLTDICQIRSKFYKSLSRKNFKAIRNTATNFHEKNSRKKGKARRSSFQVKKHDSWGLIEAFSKKKPFDHPLKKRAFSIEPICFNFKTNQHQYFEEGIRKLKERATAVSTFGLSTHSSEKTEKPARNEKSDEVFKKLKRFYKPEEKDFPKKLIKRIKSRLVTYSRSGPSEVLFDYFR